MSFRAQYRGQCADCGQELRGDEVTYDLHDELVHVRCPGRPDDVSMGDGTLCEKCFCYHAGECV